MASLSAADQAFFLLEPRERPMSIGVLLFARAGGLGEGWEVACLALAAVLVGVGQNASRAPLIAYLPIGFPDVVARHGQESLLVGFRTLERVGSIAGPFVAAGAIAVSGHATAAAVLAGGLLATTVALWLFVRGRAGGRKAERKGAESRRSGGG